MHKIIPLLPSARFQYTAHLLRLPEQDRYCRFGTLVSDVFIRSHVAAIAAADALLAWFSDDGMARGACHLATTGEIALSVEAAFREQGIGTALLDSGLALAEAQQRITTLCLSQNTWVMRKLAERGFIFKQDGAWMSSERVLR